MKNPNHIIEKRARVYCHAASTFFTQLKPSHEAVKEASQITKCLQSVTVLAQSLMLYS
jgi:hypothetical protein